MTACSECGTGEQYARTEPGPLYRRAASDMIAGSPFGRVVVSSHRRDDPSIRLELNGHEATDIDSRALHLGRRMFL